MEFVRAMNNDRIRNGEIAKYSGDVSAIDVQIRRDLAGDPAFADTAKDMQAALEGWLTAGCPMPT